MSTPPYLVIGAGPVGLSMARALKQAGLSYTHVEATDHVGGNWAHGVYETAHIISSKKTTEFPSDPMPADYPDFPSAQQMHAYFEAFADRHQLRGAIRFNTRLQWCEPDGTKWRCTFDDGTSETFTGVFVCNGHHWARNLPDWTAAFAGEVLHSKDYKRPEQLAGRRVLVLGGGNSGCDLASEAGRVASEADWSLRRGTWILPKSLFGRPSVEFISPRVPVAVQRVFVRAMVRAVIGRYSDYGLPEPEDRPFDRHPTVNSEVFHYLQHGRLGARPGVAGVDGHTVRFVDGTSAEYDVVACGTGFDVAFPFLPDGLVPVRGKVAQLIGGALVPGYPGLNIVGAYQPRYGLGPLVEPFTDMLAEWAKLQAEFDVPLVDVLQALGQAPPPSEVMDPHANLRQIRMSRLATPLLKWKAKRMARAGHTMPVHPNAAPAMAAPGMRSVA